MPITHHLAHTNLDVSLLTVEDLDLVNSRISSLGRLTADLLTRQPEIMGELESLRRRVFTLETHASHAAGSFFTAEQDHPAIPDVGPGWREEAEQARRNAAYYRGIVTQIGELLGAEAKTADDGVLHEFVLCAKVFEIVHRRLTRLRQLEKAVDHIQGLLQPPKNEG